MFLLDFFWSNEYIPALVNIREFLKKKNSSVCILNILVLLKCITINDNEYDVSYIGR